MRGLISLASFATASLFFTSVPCRAGFVNPKAPDGAQQIAHDIVARNLKNDPGSFTGLPIEDIGLAGPYLSYVNGQEHFDAGQLLTGAERTWWAYLIMHGIRGIGEVDLNARENKGKPLAFSSLLKSSSSDRVVEALRKAEELPQVKQQDYEPRLLGIPFCFFNAVWLHGKSDDLFIPIAPAPHGLTAGQPYTGAEIIAALNAATDARRNPPAPIQASPTPRN